MKIGFFHVDSERVDRPDVTHWVRGLVQSAQRCMPDVPIVHFTDLATKPFQGVGETRRKPAEPMALLRMRHHAGVDGEWLFVDTDVIFQFTCKRVFKSDFDIALTTRNWSHLKAAVGFSERMPFNTGVVFSRCPRFWQEVYTRLRQLDPERQQWMGDQEVISEIALEEPSRYVIRRLNGQRFNFPPVTGNLQAAYHEKLAEAWIVHYKGPARKGMLLERVRLESKRCA